MASETREAIVASWNRARRIANERGGLVLNHAAMAGHLLEAHDNNAEAALKFADAERLRWDWYGVVVGYLARVVLEEREGVRAKAVG